MVPEVCRRQLEFNRSFPVEEGNIEQVKVATRTISLHVRLEQLPVLWFWLESKAIDSVILSNRNERQANIRANIEKGSPTAIRKYALSNSANVARPGAPHDVLSKQLVADEPKDRPTGASDLQGRDA